MRSVSEKSFFFWKMFHLLQMGWNMEVLMVHWDYGQHVLIRKWEKRDTTPSKGSCHESVFFSRKMPEDSLETFTSKPHFENFRIINIQCHFVASATLFFETPHLWNSQKEFCKVCIVWWAMMIFCCIRTNLWARALFRNLSFHNGLSAFTFAWLSWRNLHQLQLNIENLTWGC